MQHPVHRQRYVNPPAASQAASPRQEIRQADAAATAVSPPPPKAASPASARMLCPRECLHARPLFVDEYSKPGSTMT